MKPIIKTPEQIEKIRRAGIVNNQVLDAVDAVIRAGISTEDINRVVHEKTLELGGIPAPLNFEGFPKSVCTSLNDIVCHGIPSEDVILMDGDIINVDVTTIVDGYYADASRMYCIGQVSPEAKRLVDVTKECLELSLEAVRPGRYLHEIGAIIQAHAEKNGFSVVPDICGHGVGLDFHEEPLVFHRLHKDAATNACMKDSRRYDLHHRAHDQCRRQRLVHRRGRRLDRVDGGRQPVSPVGIHGAGDGRGI